MNTTQVDNVSTSSNNSQIDEIDKLELQWKNMELSLSTFKTQVTALQQQLRALEKATLCQMKQLKKEASLRVRIVVIAHLLLCKAG